MARRNAIIAVVVVVVVAAGFGAWIARAPEAVAAPLPSTSSSAPTNDPAEVRARVLFGEVTSTSGTALSGARITIVHNSTSRFVVADAEGQFTVDPLPDDLERVEFAAAGYVSVVVDADDLPHQVEAFWAQKLVLDQAQPVILVLVASDPPRPLAGASLVRIDEVDGKRPRFNVVGTSDDNGRLPRPEADGHRYVVAHGNHGAVVVADITAASAAQITLPAAAVIDGRVVDDRRRPVTSAKIGVRPASVSDSGDDPLILGAMRVVSRRREDIVIDADGHFVLQVPARDVVIEASAAGYRPRLDLEVRPRAGVTMPLEIRLEKSPSLAGVVVDAATGAAVADAWVGIDTSNAAGRVRTDADGHFVIDELSARPASLTVEAEGYRTITVGGIDGGASRLDDLRIALPSGQGRAVVGIGVTVGKSPKGPGVLIRTVEPETPAQRAGLVANEVIVSVDGVTLDDDLAASMGRVRGAQGTRVVVGIENEQGQRRFVTIERDQIPVARNVRTR